MKSTWRKHLIICLFLGLLKRQTCDFSGQKWTLRKSSGGQNGWAPS
jgi:hypothetical protein